MLGSVQSLTFEDLRSLIQEARRQGFYIGPDQTIAAAKVMLDLTSDPERSCAPEHLKAALGSIICKSPNEQKAFYRIFENWYRARLADAMRSARERRSFRAATETDIPVSRPLPFIATAAAIILSVFLGSVIYYVDPLAWFSDPVIIDDNRLAENQAEESETQPDDGGGERDAAPDDGTSAGDVGREDGGKDDKSERPDTPRTEREAPADQTEKIEEPGPGDDSTGTEEGGEESGEGGDVTQQGGQDDSSGTTDGPDGNERPDDDGQAGTEEQSGTGGGEAGEGMDTRPQLPQLAEPTVVAAQAPSEAGWWDTYSVYFLALRNAAAVTPLVAFLAWLAWRWTSRQAWMERRAERDPPELSSLRIARPKNSLFGSKSYMRALQLLRRHHRRPTRNLDVEQTMLSTVKRIGLFSPVYETRQTSPEYLVLADRSTLSDHQAHLIRELVLQSKSEQLFVDLYYFDGDPRTCYTEKGRLDTVALEELAARHAAQRLLIAADGSALFDPIRGTPRTWTQMFSAWRERALIVPQTTDRWGAQQAALHGAGFGVIPLDENGLLSLAEAFEESGAASGEFTPPYLRPPVPPGSEYPELMIDADDRWLDPDEPVTEETLAELTGQLRNYLGARGFELLTACAAFPQPHWDVTVYLDQVLHGDQDPGSREKRLVMLAQLPWFRRGSMPDYLRLHFLRQLPAARESEVKIALQELLRSALDAPPGAVEIEVAHGARRGLKRTISDFFQFGTPPDHESLHDHIFIRFVLGGRPGPLDIALPRILQKVLPWKGWDSFTMRAAVRGAGGLACALLIWSAFTLFEGPMRGVSVLSALHEAHLGDGLTFAGADARTTAGPMLQSLEFSPTEDRFIAVDTGGNLVLGRADATGIRSQTIADLNVTKAQFIAGGQEVLVERQEGALELYRVADLELGYLGSPRSLEPHTVHALNPARTHLVSARGDEVVHTRFGQFQRPNVAFTHPEPVDLVAMDTEAATISAISRNYLSIYSVETGAGSSWAFADRHHDLVGDTPPVDLWQVNQSRILVRYGNGHMMALEEQQATIVSYPGERMPSAAASFAAPTLWGPDERLYPIQFGGGAPHLLAWDSAEGEVEDAMALSALRGHGLPVFDALVDRTGRFAATLSNDRTVRIWDLQRRDEVAVLRDSGDGFALAALSPDNQHLLTVARDGRLQLWDVSELLEETDVPPVPSDEPIVIAVAGPREGDGAARTQEIDGIARDLVAAINEQDGVIARRVVLVEAEDGCDPDRALAEAESLAERSVTFVIGHGCAGVSDAVAQRYEELGIVHISLAPRPAESAGPGDTTFYLGRRFGDREGELAGAMLAENFAASRIAIVHDGTAQREGLARQVKFALNRREVREVLFTAFDSQTDEAELVTELQEEQAEVVYFASSHSLAGLLVRIAASRGYHPQLVASSALANSTFGDIAGADGDGALILVPNPQAPAPPAADAELTVYQIHMALLAWAEAVTEAGDTAAEPVSDALAARLASDYAWSDSFPPLEVDPQAPAPYLWHVWENGVHHEHRTRPMALLVGVGSFESFEPLEAPARDLTRMRSFVQTQLGYSQDDIITLADEDATFEDVIAAMRRLSTFTGPGDRVLVYISSRGGQVADLSGDEGDGLDETILLHDSSTGPQAIKQLTDDAFDAMLDRLAGRELTVVLETDHLAGAALEGEAEMVRRAEASFIEAGPHRRIWSATAPLQQRRTDEAGSVFTRLFVTGAGAERAADVNRDGVVTNGEQLYYVRGGAYSWCAASPDCSGAGFSPWLESAPEDLAAALAPPDAQPAQGDGTDAPVPSLADTYGLLIGIDVYANLDDIQGAAADARDIHSALLESGVPAENLTLMLDSAATRPAILAAWEDLVARTGSGDTIVLSYAGHGLQMDETESGSEADAKDEAIALTGYLGPTEDVLRDNDFRAMFAAASQAARVVTVFDTEWGGDFTDAGEAGNGPLTNVTYTAAVEDGTSMSVYPLNGEPRGALSLAFADAVRGAADRNHDLMIDARELEIHLRDQVDVTSGSEQQIVFSPPGSSENKLLRVAGANVEVPPLEDPLRVYVMGMGDPTALLQQLTNVVQADMQAAELVIDAKSGQLLVGGSVVAAVEPMMAPAQIQPLIHRWLLVRDLERLAAPDRLDIALGPEQRNYDQGSLLEVTLTGARHANVSLLHVDSAGVVRLVGDPSGAPTASFEIAAEAGAPVTLTIRLPDQAPNGAGRLIALVGAAPNAPFVELPAAPDGSVRSGRLLQLLHDEDDRAPYQHAAAAITVEPHIDPPPGSKLAHAEQLTEGLVFQFGHATQVNTTIFTPDGQTVLSGSNDGVINMWDVERKLLVDGVQTDLGAVLALAVTPDGRYVLAGGGTGTVDVWQIDGLRLVYRFTGLEAAVTDVAISADGRHVLAGGGRNVAMIWDFETGEALYTLEGHKDWISAVAFSPDGAMAATGSDDNSIMVWDARSGANLRTLQGHENRILSLDFSPDGRQLLSGSADQTMRLWTVETGNEVARFTDYTDWVRSVQFAPDGATALSSDDNRFVKIWDIADRTLVHRLEGHTDWVVAARYSEDGRMVVSGSADQTVRLWDVEAGRLVHTFGGIAPTAFATAFTAGGDRVVTTVSNGGLRVWDVRTGALASTFMVAGTPISVVAAMPDGQHLLIANEWNIDMIDITSGERVRRFQGHKGRVLEIAVSPDGQMIATSSADFAVRVWNTRDEEIALTLREHQDWVRALTFSADGRFLFSGADDKSIIQWELLEGGVVRRFAGHDGWVNALAASPDGTRLASGSQDNSIRIWNVETGELERTIADAGSSSLGLRYTPDGRFVIGGDGKTMAKWDAATGERSASYDNGALGVTDIAMSPDGVMLAAAGSEGLSLWRAEQPTPLGRLMAVGEADYLILFPDGRWTGTEGALAERVIWFEGRQPLDTAPSEHPSYYGPVATVDFRSEAQQ